jgi:hypothetical protein
VATPFVHAERTSGSPVTFGPPMSTPRWHPDEWDRFTPADHREALSRVLRHIVVMPGPFVPGERVVPVPAWEE